MREVFCDTHYFVALLDPRDAHHQQAIQVTQSLEGYQFVTSQYIFLELLNFFSAYGVHLRRLSVDYMEKSQAQSDTVIVPQNEELFCRGLELYKQREDKGYSLTDCISMNIIKDRGIKEVLTNDGHFRQEGFKVLLN